MTERDRDLDALETLFDAARRDTPPNEAFLASLAAQATDAAGRNAAPRPERHVKRRAPLWQRWLPVSGLTAATLAGLWIGITLPDSDLATDYLAGSGYDETGIAGFLPAYGLAAFGEVEG